MRGYYEKSREENRDIHVSYDRLNTYPEHFHMNFEIYILTAGEFEATVNKTTYRLQGGDILLVDSYDIHSYRRVSENARGVFLVIPFACLQEFNAVRHSLPLAERVLHHPALAAEARALLERYLPADSASLLAQSTVRLLLAMLLPHLSFAEKREEKDATPMRVLLTYIAAHYRAPLSRRLIARELGYTESHLSRLFHRYMHVGLPEYIACLRLAYVEKCRKEGDRRPLTELVFEAGFGSLQSYFRYKKKMAQ